MENTPVIKDLDHVSTMSMVEGVEIFVLNTLPGSSWNLYWCFGLWTIRAHILAASYHLSACFKETTPRSSLFHRMREGQVEDPSLSMTG